MLFYLPVFLSLGPRRKLGLDLLQFSIWHCFTKMFRFFPVLVKISKTYQIVYTKTYVHVNIRPLLVVVAQKKFFVECELMPKKTVLQMTR